MISPGDVLGCDVVACFDCVCRCCGRIAVVLLCVLIMCLRCVLVGCAWMMRLVDVLESCVVPRAVLLMCFDYML